MPKQELVELCMGECAVCASGEGEHALVTPEQYQRVLDSHMKMRKKMLDGSWEQEQERRMKEGFAYMKEQNNGELPAWAQRILDLSSPAKSENP